MTQASVATVLAARGEAVEFDGDEHSLPHGTAIVPIDSGAEVR
ncbi:MAG: hypothetical protein ACFCD0_23130 [Gemmataceae bacterium]